MNLMLKTAPEREKSQLRRGQTVSNKSRAEIMNVASSQTVSVDVYLESLSREMLVFGTRTRQVTKGSTVEGLFVFDSLNRFMPVAPITGVKPDSLGTCFPRYIVPLFAQKTTSQSIQKMYCKDISPRKKCRVNAVAMPKSHEISKLGEDVHRPAALHLHAAAADPVVVMWKTSNMKSNDLEEESGDGTNTGESSAGVERGGGTSELWAVVASGRWHVVGLRASSLVVAWSVARGSGVVWSTSGETWLANNWDGGDNSVGGGGGASWAVGDGGSAGSDGDNISLHDSGGDLADDWENSGDSVNVGRGAGWARSNSRGTAGDGDEVGDHHGGGDKALGWGGSLSLRSGGGEASDKGSGGDLETHFDGCLLVGWWLIKEVVVLR